jgi:hypothetical protein
MDGGSAGKAGATYVMRVRTGMTIDILMLNVNQQLFVDNQTSVHL